MMQASSAVTMEERPSIKFLLDMLGDVGVVRSRAMSGGYGMIGLVASGDFYLKFDSRDGNTKGFELPSLAETIPAAVENATRSACQPLRRCHLGSYN
ncbi:MAG: hypothetical protein O3C40_18075 [Planctomycetota bacterium]|nr:hypothetical protein [Planctomycetota bacterium]